jgi:DNA-directed RNA polymerase specialized sigma24 family protein
LAYEEISRRLGIPIGSIGPTRARAFAQLRATEALRNLSERTVGSEQTGDRA